MFKFSAIKFEYNIRNKNRESRDGTHGRKWYEKILILAFSAFFATPLTIIFWAAAWDIISLTIFPDDMLKSCFVSAAISKSFLLVFYLCQEYMQGAHDFLFRKSKMANSPLWSRLLYFSLTYLMRTIYGFVLSLVYILQYRSYWDAYNEYTAGIDYKYFFGLAIVTIIAYRYMLNGNFSSYCKTVPFELVIDESYDAFFLQGTFIKIKNKWIQKIANYFYFEWLEMLISIFVWKGIYDVVDSGTVNLFKNVQTGDTPWISILFTGILSYGLFFLFTLFKDFIRFESDKVFKKFSHFFLDFVDFLAYWAMVGCWRVAWDIYDIFAYDVNYVSEENEILFFWITLVVIFLICIVLGISANLYGPAGSVEEEEETEIDENETSETKNHKSYKTNSLTIVEKF